MRTQSEITEAMHLGNGWYSDIGIGKYEKQLLVQSPKYDTEFIDYVKGERVTYVLYKYRKKVEDANRIK